MSGFLDNGAKSIRNNINKFLKKLSSLGMEYDDLVLKNSQAIGMTENQFWNQMNLGAGEISDEYKLFASFALSDVSLRKRFSVFDENYKRKKEELARFAKQDLIEDVLEIISDEAIVYDENNFFCYPVYKTYDLLDEEVNEKVNEALHSNFKKIYSYFGFHNDYSAWNYFKKWLIYGYLAFEIIYDNKGKRVIGFKELEPESLTPDVVDGKKIWIQYKGDTNKERVLFDSQIIYISYAHSNVPSKTSYVERLIRPYNILKIMEMTRIVWAVVNSSYKTKFIIPVGGKSKTRAKQSLGVLMQSYREVIDFDMESGELRVNGKPMFPFNKEYWLPENDSGRPEIETIGNDGPDLSDTDALRYFREEFLKITKVPLSRFEYENPSSWSSDAESYTRDEIKFGRFINRLQTQFKEIILKPLWAQMALDFPELANDDTFKTSIGLRFNKDNVFEKMKEMDILEKQISFIQTMQDSLIEYDDEGNEVKFFSSEFLVRKYLGMNEDDLKLNEKYKERKKKGNGETDE